MDIERTTKALQVALASYDRKELRVQKHFLEEQSLSAGCTCFRSGSKLLMMLQQGCLFDVVIICGELEDMSGLEFVMKVRRLEHHPMVLIFDDGRRRNESALCVESGNGIFYFGQMELKSLLRELYRLPGQQGQKTERQCQELYQGWGLQLQDVNCSYLTCAVDIVFSTQQKLAIRKEILQPVGQRFNVSVSAVDSGIRRMIDQLEANPTDAWTAFKEENGFAREKLTTGKLIYAIKNHLRRQTDE